MSKVIDEFYKDMLCDVCKVITEHHVEEYEGEGYFAKCDVCDNIEELDNV